MDQPCTSDASRLLPSDDLFGLPEYREGIVVQNENSSFVALKTVPLAIIQIVFNGVLFVESVLFLHFVDYCKNQTTPVENHPVQAGLKSVFETDCGSVIIYSVALIWILTWTINAIFKILHRRHRNFGYLQFHSDSAYIADIPFFAICAGGFVLVIALTLKLDHILFNDKFVFGERRFWLFLQIFTGTEFLVVCISMTVYIVKVFKFNSSQPVPDVFSATNISSMPLIFNSRSAIEMGPGVGAPSMEADLLQSVCERQGDLIIYLRHRCDVLCAKLHEVATVNT